MTFSFTRTRDQLATLVLGKLGVIASGVAASTQSADADLVYEAIDLRLKESHKLGIVWRNVAKTPLSFSLTANINSASASVDILFPIALTVTDASLDEPVMIIGPIEYAAIDNKGESGLPTKALWKGSAEFIFHPVPTQAATAKLVYESIADDTAANTAIDLDVAQLRAFRDMICYDLGDFYGIPEQKMMRWKAESEIAERAIRKMNALRVDYGPVQVEDCGYTNSRPVSDYGL